jgi:hypothetical protein
MSAFDSVDPAELRLIGMSASEANELFQQMAAVALREAEASRPKYTTLEQDFPHLSAATIARFREAGRTNNRALVGLPSVEEARAQYVEDQRRFRERELDRRTSELLNCLGMGQETAELRRQRALRDVYQRED